MPAKNTVKPYTANGIYHIYNVGVDNRPIFQEDQDYQTFLSLLASYLSPHPLDPLPKEKPSRLRRRQNMNLSSEIRLLAYCLMPNHFHLLAQQTHSDSITKLLRRVATSYVTYFNRKYHRSGTLFQNIYKAVLIADPHRLLHLSRYIHLNPISTKKIGPLRASLSPADYPYSSYQKYLDLGNSDWLNTQVLLSLLPASHPSYQAFVEDRHPDSASLIQSLTLE